MTWWRRQRFALAALMVAAMAATGVHLWFDAVGASGPQPEISITDDDTGEVGGHVLALTSSRWGEFDAPQGSTALSVRLDARSGADAEICRSFSLTEIDGGRVWLQARGEIDVDYGEAASSCEGDSASYGILAVFLLPEDAAGPFWFDVSAGDSVQRFRVVV